MAEIESGTEMKGGQRRMRATWELGPQRAELVESGISMWLAYGANCGSSAGRLGAGKEGRSGPALTALYTGKAGPTELKDDTDVSLRPSQPSVTGSRPSHAGPGMRRERWETCDDHSEAGSRPVNMAVSQQLLSWRRCGPRTDGRTRRSTGTARL